MADGADNPGREKSRVADQGSWTGRHIISLVRMHKFESSGGERDGPLMDRIDRAVAYLYRRGARSGRHRVGRYAQAKPPARKPTPPAGPTGLFGPPQRKRGPLPS